MKPLFPDVAEQLCQAADRLAPEGADVAAPTPQPHGGRRRRWHTGTFVLIGALALTSGAYAARGLWQPELGTEHGRPTAIAGPPSNRVLDRIAPLRREQTEADRGAESQSALKFPDEKARIRTDFVRLLQPKGSQEPLVLVPMDMSDGTERLCLWIRDRGSSQANLGGRGCTTPERFLQGHLVLGTGEQPDRVKEAPLAALRRKLFPLEDERRRLERRDQPIPADLRDRIEALHAKLQAATEVMLAGHTLRVVGVVPDGVAKVSIGEPARIVDVHDNTFAVVVPEAELAGMTPTYLDEHGAPIPWAALGVDDPKG